MTTEDRRREIVSHPENHVHTYDALVACCMVDGAPDTMLMQSHEGIYGEITYEQQIDSTLSKECFFAETDTECSLCKRPDCTHYCHTDAYKLWRATDTLIAFIILVDIRRMLHGDEDIIKQFPIMKKAAYDVSKLMDRVRRKK